MLRIGLLTSGGDCQALNATMRAIVKTLAHGLSGQLEIYGFEDGYQGLIYKRYRVMTPACLQTIAASGRIFSVDRNHDELFTRSFPLC